MSLLLWTFVVTTVGETAGLIWWMAEMERGQSVSAYAGLVAGETIELAMFVYYLLQTPSKGGGRRFSFVVGLMVLIAFCELIVWAIWRSTLEPLGLAAGAGVLFALMHLKHDADVATISDTGIGRTWFTLKGFAATGLEALGATLAIHLLMIDRPILAAASLVTCITVEHIFGGLIVGEALGGRDFLTPNPQRFEGRQNSMTVVSSVKPDRFDTLTTFLRQIGNNVNSTSSFPIANLGQLHFCCWCVARRESDRPVLIFEANFDGPVEEFLDELVRVLNVDLADVYRHCEEMSDAPTVDEIRSHLTKRHVFTHTFYIGAHGLTVKQILRDEELRQEIEAFVDALQAQGAIDSASSPKVIRSKIQEHINNISKYSWAQEPARIPWNLVYGPLIVKAMSIVATVVALAALAVVVYTLFAAIRLATVPYWAFAVSAVVCLAVIAAVLYVLRLRHLEVHDPQPDFRRPKQPNSLVFLRENQQAINHLANVAPLKLGVTRWLTIHGVLFVVHWGARLIFNRGVLAGTSTIHFARWAIINGGKDLLFLSNYDGSWDRYLSDFVDRSSQGLTAIWGNTIEFPRTRWLIFGGAANEEKFKAAAHRRQIESHLWYSAYPQLTMSNIQSNEALRAGLYAPLDAAETMAWLLRL